MIASSNGVTADPVQTVLSHLENVSDAGEQKWTARCPAHEDNRNSLSVARGDDGRALLHCHAGCKWLDIATAAQLEIRDLFIDNGRNGKSKRKSEIVATYDYHDTDGKVVFQAVRMKPKDFRQRKPDSKGGWSWSVKGCPVLPYRLPDILADSYALVFVVEGEKDADRLHSLGLIATCNPGGAGKWRKEHAEFLRGRDVVILPDNDEAGRKHADGVAWTLCGKAGSTTVVELPDLRDKGDVSDWLDAGGTVDQLLAIINDTPEWKENVHLSQPGKRPLTDLGNCERLVDHFGDRIRYVGTWERWLAWDGSRWSLDETGAVEQFTKSTVRKIYGEAGVAKDTDSRKQISEWAERSENNARIAAAIKLGQSEPTVAVHHDQLDAEPWLLNCKNGVVDLKTGELLPHDRDKLLTKSTGINYPTSPATELWAEFLDAIFSGDVELIAFLQRLMGLSLVGRQVEHLMPIFYGKGANGKSVFINTMLAALGDYGMVGPSGMFMAKRHENHPTELADLFGRRLVLVSETRDGQRLDEGLVKSVTGGDKIRARRMRENFWEFEPSHLPIIVTNHKPRVRGNDYGIWRRLRLIPFTVTIPEDRRDAHLPEKLRNELPGILEWAVAGCLDWQQGGLREPQSVLDATGDYRDSSDSVACWLSECCDQDSPGGFERAKTLRDSYVEWCQQAGEKPLGPRLFGEELKQRFEWGEDKQSRFYRGVELAFRESDS